MSTICSHKLDAYMFDKRNAFNLIFSAKVSTKSCTTLFLHFMGNGKSVSRLTSVGMEKADTLDITSTPSKLCSSSSFLRYCLSRLNYRKH